MHGNRTRFRISTLVATILGFVGGATALATPSGAAASRPAGWSSLCTGSIGGAATPLVAGVNCRLITSGGLTRRYVAYVPGSVAASANDAPVVFMFHGSTGTGEQFLTISGWRQVADQEGLIAAFPTGMSYRILETGRMSTKWHDFGLSCEVSPNRPSGWPASAPYPADDGGFVDSMISDLRASGHVDTDRIYASGFSNGSAFAQSLAITHADTFAAVGSWAGRAHECLDANGNAVEPIVTPETPIPVALGFGTKDQKLLEGINGYLTAHGQPTITSIPLTLSAINGVFGTAILRDPVTQNGLVWEPGTAIGVGDWAGVAWQSTWKPPAYVTAEWSTAAPGTSSGNSFVFILLDRVKHHYPNALPGKPSWIAQSGSVNAAELFWQFFERHVGSPARSS
jgi:poly(3-hydroxybutyrate) depolymerase